jgi:hypothetical protein
MERERIYSYRGQLFKPAFPERNNKDDRGQLFKPAFPERNNKGQKKQPIN